MKSNANIVDLLDQFQYGCQHHFRNIYKAIKSISVSSKDYYTFNNNYLQTTQVNSFKQPDVEYYPILQHNELISLTKRTYKCSKDIPRIQSSRPKANQQFQSSFLVTNPNIHQKPRPKSKMAYTLLKDSSNTQRKNLLRDLIFNDSTYDTMHYDERTIFHKEKEYLAYIKDKVDSFKNSKCSDHTTEVNRYFNNDQVYLQFKSITLEFRNMTDKTKKPITFEIPFTYLPLFYYKDFDNMKYILLALINFNSQYDNITLNENAIYHLLKTSVEYTTESQMTTQANNDACFSRRGSLFDDLENNILTSESKENGPRIQIKDKTMFNDTQSNGAGIGVGPGLFNQYNAYHYLWITPVNMYQLEIKMPEITMVFPKFKKEINKTIDNELLFYLIMNDFNHWDFYIVNYLLSLKAFRWVLQSTISKSFHFTFKENDIIKQKAHDEIMKHISIKSFKGVDYYSLSKRRVKSINEKEREFYFFQTDDILNNHLMILHNYQVTILNRKMHSNKEFIFSFNLKQMRQLNAVSHWQYLSSFFNKIVTVDLGNDVIYLNYEVFDHLSLKEEVKWESNQLLTDTSSKGLKKKENDLNIVIVYPYLEKVDYLRELNVQATSIISDTNESVHRVLTSDVLEEICVNDLCNWPAILSTFRSHNHTKTITVQMKRVINKDKSTSNAKANNNKRYTYDKSMLLRGFKPERSKGSIYQLQKLNFK